MEGIKEGDIVRTTKYAQPLEVVKVLPAIREAITKPQGSPEKAAVTAYPYKELKPYVKE